MKKEMSCIPIDLPKTVKEVLMRHWRARGLSFNAGTRLLYLEYIEREGLEIPTEDE